MKAIPVAVRERILKLYGQGRSTAGLAASFGYCVAAVRRVRQRFQERGTLEPPTHRCGRKTLLTDARKARPLQLLDQHPDATLAELAAPFKQPTSTLDLWLTRLGWSCKKTRPASEPSRPDAAAQRKQWPQRLAGVSAARLVFVDESGANTQMTRRWGRSPVGRRLVGPVPHEHDPPPMIAAVRLQGPQAPWLFGGALHDPLFLAWVQQGLEPGLHPNEVGSGTIWPRTRWRACGKRWRGPGRDWNTCRPIRRTSTRWNRCGARSSRGSKAGSPGRSVNCTGPPGRPLPPSPPLTARGSLYMPTTLHNTWKRSQSLPAKCRMP